MKLFPSVYRIGGFLENAPIFTFAKKGYEPVSQDIVYTIYLPHWIQQFRN